MKTTTEPRVERELWRDFARLHPHAAAAELERLTSVEVSAFLNVVAPAEATALIAAMTTLTAVRALEMMSPSDAGRLIAALEVVLAARILAATEASRRELMLGTQEPARAAELRQLLSYRPDSAGALMDSEVLALRPQTTVRDALKRLREQRHKRIHRVFLVDSEQRLSGAVRLRDLALAEPSTPLHQLEVEQSAVPVMASREEVVDVLTRTRAVSLPVVDFDGRLVGVLRHDALIDAARDDVAADLLSMVGAGKEERALSPASLAVRKRLPWLQVNLGTAFLAASVVGVFEDTIARNTALAVLLPVVAGQSGNTGAQALAVTMRGLALREIRTPQWLRVCFKELQVGFFNGIAVALTTALAVLLWSGSSGLALVIGVSMVISMVAAGFSGAGIPMVLSAIGQDPAQSSSIILTTVTDVVGFFSFLGIATLLSTML